MSWCEFEQTNNGHVKCMACGRGFSGTPKDYNGRIICEAIGPGAEFNKCIQSFASKLRMDVKECKGCNKLKMVMNANGKTWCKENKHLITALAHYNAKQRGMKVPRFLIRLALTYSLR